MEIQVRILPAGGTQSWEAREAIWAGKIATLAGLGKGSDLLVDHKRYKVSMICLEIIGDESEYLIYVT